MKAMLFLLKDRGHLKDSICNRHSWCSTTERKKDPQEIHDNCQSHELASEHRDGIVTSTDWGKDTKKEKRIATLKVPETTMASIDLTWTTKTLPRVDRLTKLSNLDKRISAWGTSWNPRAHAGCVKSVSEGQHAPSKLPAARKEGQNSSVREHSKAYYCQPEKTELTKNHLKLCVRARGRGSTVPPPPAQVGCCMT